MKTYRVTYTKKLYETYFVKARDKKEAEKLAQERELDDEPDDETSDCDKIEVEEVK